MNLSLIHPWNYTSSMRKIFPPLRIHIWGGLGSQLFAVAFAINLKKKFKNRKLILVLHTGGVTERKPEILDLFPDFEYKIIRDFSEKSASTSTDRIKYSILPHNFFQTYIKLVLKNMGIVASCNNDIEFSKLKPWAIEIRGHYSYQTIDANFHKQLFEILTNAFGPAGVYPRKNCAIHYRLGDLLTLDNKDPISLDDIIGEYERINRNLRFNKLVIYSDSPIVAFENFKHMGIGNIETPVIETTEVLFEATQSVYFIGTSSKVSFWIAALRSVVLDSRSSLPVKNLLQYKEMLGDKISLINTYKTKS